MNNHVYAYRYHRNIWMNATLIMSWQDYLNVMFGYNSIRELVQ